MEEMDSAIANLLQPIKVAVQESQSIAPKRNNVSSAIHALLVVLGAVFLSWPAIYNGYPLMYWDGVEYLAVGHKIAGALFLHRLSPTYGARSVFYSLAIYPFHWGAAPWLVVAMQCLLVAWVLWLVVRSIAASYAETGYICLMLLLTLLTSVGWYTSFVMPDILAPVLCLAIYLLVYAGDSLSRVERIALSLIAWWCITAHGSHLLLAASLCLLLAAATFLEQMLDRRKCRAEDFRAVGQFALIVIAAVVSQLAFYGFLYGKPSLTGPHPPFLMARVITDGPGRWYLKQHCPQEHWVICDDMSSISTDSATLLFDPTDSWSSSTESVQLRMEAEEVPLVLAILRTYPRQEFLRAAANFRHQLGLFDLYGFSVDETLTELAKNLSPQLVSGYLGSRQARDALPLRSLSQVEWWVVIASLAIIARPAPFFVRQPSRRLAGLCLLIAATIFGNACITGVISKPDPRFQCRVIWLVPFLAGLLLLDCFAHRRRGSGS